MYETALLLGLLLSCGIFAYFAMSVAFSIYHPLFFYSAFHFLVFVIRPIASVIYGYHLIYDLYGFQPTESTRLVAYGVAQLGYVTFAFFSMRAGHVPFRFKNDVYALEERRRLSQYFFVVLLICGPIAVYSLARYYTDTANYFGGMVRDEVSGVMMNTTSNGYVQEAQLMLISLVATIAWIGRFRWQWLLPLGAFVVFRAGTGGRGPFISAVTACLLLFLYDRRRRLPNARIMGAIVGLAMLFSAVGADRGSAVRSLMGIESDQPQRVVDDTQAPLESMDIANMEFLEFIVDIVPAKTGTYDYFLANLQLFTEPIPRVWWPGKPAGAPIKTFSMFDYGNPIGMTASLPGSGWIELGWAGVIIWCGLFGHVLGRLYTGFVESDQSTLKALAYMIMLSTLVVGYRDGALLTIAKQNLMYQAPIIMWFLTARYFGLPRLGEIRVRATRIRRQLLESQKTVVEGTGDAPVAGTLHRIEVLRDSRLPPAVQRRRAALRAARESKT